MAKKLKKLLKTKSKEDAKIIKKILSNELRCEIEEKKKKINA